MAGPGFFKDSLGDLDAPIDWEESNVSLFKKKKLRVTIRYEDGSHRDYFIKLKKAYRIKIKKGDYIIVPKAISQGKNPTIEYYFNNPWPIGFKHENSKLNPTELWSKGDFKLLPEQIQTILTNTTIDSETLQAAFNSNWLKSMYARPGLTPKTIIIIIIIIAVVLLIILQATGTADIIGFFTHSGGK
jgi:hypothetical protein